MKKTAILLLTLLLCTLLLGTTHTAPPVAHSKNYYINDFAGIIFQEHRRELSDIAAYVWEETSVQLVVLTVEHTAGMELEEFAQQILKGWEIGGPEGIGALLVAVSDTNRSYIAVGSGLEAVLLPQRVEEIENTFITPYFKSGNYSTGILKAYKCMVLDVATAYGVTPKEQWVQRIDPTKPQGIPSILYVFIPLALIIALRGVRVSRKYREKYLHRYNPLDYRRTYTKTRSGFDVLSEAKDIVYPEDMANVRKEGFIIHRIADEEDSEQGTGQDTPNT